MWKSGWFMEKIMWNPHIMSFTPNRFQIIISTNFFNEISRNSFLLKCFIHRELNASNMIFSCRYFCGFLGNFPVVYFCAVNNVWNYQQFFLPIIFKFNTFYLGRYFWVLKVILNMLLWKFWKRIWRRITQEK